MNPVLALSYAQAVLTAIPALLSLGVSISALVSQANGVLSSGQDPTPADWDAVNTVISTELDALKAKLAVAAPAALQAVVAQALIAEPEGAPL